MEPGIPLIFFHMGDSYYLQYTFNQILQSNPNSDIYLIGNDANRHYESLGIKHVDMTTCEKTAKEFEKIYVHLSCMGGFVERICFQRWMYIRDFVLQQGWTGRFCCLDSDVLVYGDITAYCDTYCPDADVTLHGKYGPGCNVFKNVDVLTQLVETIFKYYTTDRLLEKLKNRYTVEKRNVTDMTMIEAFVDECDVNTFDLLQIVDDMTFDSHLAKKSDPRFDMQGQFKKTRIRNGQVFCFKKETGAEIRMMLLHIQGYYKMYMYRYYTADPKVVDSVWKARFRMLYQQSRRKAARLLRR